MSEDSIRGRADAEKLQLAYLAPDATQGSVTKRIVCFQEGGFDVTSYTFTRDRSSVLDPVCENVSLGAVPNRHYLRRVMQLMLVVGKFLPKRKDLRSTQVFYARMLDMALLGMLLRRLFNPSAVFYYEVPDVHGIFVNTGVKGKLARWLERKVLDSTDCVVVSSPWFVAEYLKPVQNFRGRTFLLENRMFSRDLEPLRELRRELVSSTSTKHKLIIAWFGNLDDPWTWNAIQKVAEKYPYTVHFYLRGYVVLDEEMFESYVENQPNVTYDGAFNNRTDLEFMYGQVDVVLGLDMMDKEGNSLWLLPNSLYESGAYCKPLITSSGTATATRVAELGSGWVLDEPVVESLGKFVGEFDWRDYDEKVKRLCATDPAQFAGQDRALELAQQMAADSRDRP